MKKIELKESREHGRTLSVQVFDDGRAHLHLQAPIGGDSIHLETEQVQKLREVLNPCRHQSTRLDISRRPCQVCQSCGEVETIVGVAIRFEDDGSVIQAMKPNRHVDLICEYEAGVDHTILSRAHDKGFITSFGRWVRRAPAAAIAYAAGQIEEPTQRLLSEDVW